MGGQAAERFSNPEGYVPLPRGHEQDSHLDRFYSGPHLPNLTERPNFSSTAEDDSLPGIEGLIIVGDAVLGGRLTACGYPINGMTLCIFQWVRHLPDGSRTDIEGTLQSPLTFCRFPGVCVLTDFWLLLSFFWVSLLHISSLE
jgi:hypothetical protein